jgi:hypothetical protein
MDGSKGESVQEKEGGKEVRKLGGRETGRQGSEGAKRLSKEAKSMKLSSGRLDGWASEERGPEKQIPRGARDDKRFLGGHPPRVFCRKSVEVAENAGDEFLKSAKECARM